MAEQRKLRLNSGGAEQVDSGGAEQIAQCDCATVVAEAVRQCDGRGGGSATRMAKAKAEARMAKANDEGTIDGGGDA